MLYPFKDDFEQDLGWQTAITQTGSGPQSGTWERGVPVGTNYQPGGGNPNGSGGACYATELAATTDGSNDVDDIETTLTSPAVDLAGVQSAKLVYYRWYARNNVPGSGADPFRVEVSNDGFATSTLVEEIVTGTGGWQRFEYDIPQALLTADFRIRYTISDLPNDNIVEAAVDDVSIEVPQCEVFGETPQQCAQAIRAIRQLVALKEGNDIRFDWASELHARGGYRLYSVTDSTGIPNAHAGNPAAALAGETVGVTSTSVVEAGSVPGSPGDIRYYQVVGVCPGGSPEGPN
jgi:hypothetical protein